MSTFSDLFEGEITNIKHIINSLPFNRSDQSQNTSYFLDVYQVDRHEFQRLNEDDSPFPLDTSKFLKLGISLGNLVKSLQQDEEQYLELQRKNQQFNRSLGGALQPSPNPNQPNILSGQQSNVNVSQGLNLYQMNPQLSSLLQQILSKPQALEGNFFERRVLSSSSSGILQVAPSSNQVVNPIPVHQTKFSHNLLKILKNFDVGTNNTSATISSMSSSLANSTSNLRPDLPPPHMLSTSSSLTILGQPVQSSPIKLSSKQLLIEKLEINIDLDNLFTYKTVLKVIQRIYEIILVQLENSGNANVLTSVLVKDFTLSSSSSSIFSTASYSSTDLTMAVEEYLILLKQIVLRLSAGVLEPFIQVVVSTIAEVGINERFGAMLKSLDM